MKRATSKEIRENSEIRLVKPIHLYFVASIAEQIKFFLTPNLDIDMGETEICHNIDYEGFQNHFEHIMINRKVAIMHSHIF